MKYTIKLYEEITGDKCPDNQIEYHEWYNRYVKWLEKIVETNMDLKNREKYLLKKLLMYDINRYIMVNSHGRLDGFEKAQHHIKISEILTDFILYGFDDFKQYREYLLVHDYLADNLTSKMDEVIGFPIDRKLYGEDITKYSERFFDKLIDMIPDLEVFLKNNIKDLEN